MLLVQRGLSHLQNNFEGKGVGGGGGGDGDGKGWEGKERRKGGGGWRGEWERWQCHNEAMYRLMFCICMQVSRLPTLSLFLVGERVWHRAVGRSVLGFTRKRR